MREWLAGVVGENLAPIVSVVLSAAIVVLLALAIIGLAKRVFAGSGGIGGRSRAPRLAILDVTAVDPKRKLVLVRRDDTEHLLLIGGQNDLVVEGGIQRVRTRRVEPAASSRVEPEPVIEPAPAPAPPQRRVPVATPIVSVPRAAPPLVVDPPQAPPQPQQPVPAPMPRAATPPPVREPMREPTPEPADLRVTPAVRAQPQDASAPQLGERQLPTRNPSDEAPANPPTAVPPLPAFLGMLGNRAPAASSTPQPAPIARQPLPLPEAQKPAPAPRVPAEPVAAEPKIEPKVEPVLPASPPQPPIQPRSMATPTLPQPPVATPPTPREEVRREDARRDEPQREEPAAPVAPMVLADEPLLPTEDTSPAPPPERPRETGDNATPARPAAEPPLAPERQPLSVRSFATTIQARRSPATPTAPTPAATAPAVEPPRAPNTTERSEPPRVEAQRSDAAPSASGATPAERPLTLEEEMERLLHDFTLDVSERR